MVRVGSRLLRAMFVRIAYVKEVNAKIDIYGNHETTSDRRTFLRLVILRPSALRHIISV